MTTKLYPGRWMHPEYRYDEGVAQGTGPGRKVFAINCSGALCGPSRVMARRTGPEEFCDENGENCVTPEVYFSATVGVPYDYGLQLVEADCFSPFGVPRRLLIQVSEVSACPGVSCQFSDFIYSDSDHKWHGAASLPGGSITITGECQGNGSMHLTLDGCGISDTTDAALECNWPVSFGIAQWTSDTCCDCEGGGGTIAISIDAPVYPRTYAKLVDYDPVSGRKIFARPRCDPEPACSTQNCCAKLACNLHATFEADPLGPCACVDGMVITLIWDGIGWTGTSGTECGNCHWTLTLQCINDVDDPHCGTIHATLSGGADCGNPGIVLTQVCDSPDTPDLDECADPDFTFGMSSSCATSPPPNCCEGGFRIRITK